MPAFDGQARTYLSDVREELVSEHVARQLPHGWQLLKRF